MNSSGVLNVLRNLSSGVMRSIAAFLLLISATAAAAPRAGSGEVVTLQLKWRHSFQFAGYYAAIEKGFYRGEGLRVELIEGRPGVDFIAQVVSGQADYGVENPALLLARSRGEPVVVLAAVFQHSPLVLLTRKGVRLCTPQDLIRKKVMLTRDADAEILAMFAKEGVPVGEIDILAHSWNLEDLISGRVDAVSAYLINEPFVLAQNGFETCTIHPLTYGIDFYGDCLFTSEKELRKHHERVAAFRRASLRGWDYALAHPEEMIALIRQKYGPDESEEKLQFQAEEMRKLMVPEFVSIGHMNPGRWQHIAKTYADVGMLPPGYSLDGFLYSPETGRLPHQARRAIIILSVLLLLVVLLIVVLYLFNRKIRLIVSARTEELSQANALLTREAAERWRSERIARDSSENLAITLRSIGDAVIAADYNGRVTQMNPVAEALTGWTEEEALRRPIEEVFHIVQARTREKAVNPMESVLRNGVKVGLANHTVLISRSGTEYQIADSAAPIRNAAGKVTGVVLVFRDVTEAYAQEERLRKSEAKYRMFFENSHDAMLIIENGKFIDCNASAVSLLGYAHKEELIRHRPEELSPEVQPDGRRSAEKAEEMMRTALEQRGHRFEWDHLRKDGSAIPIEVSLTAVEGAGGIRLQAVWRDLTGRKQAERDRQEAQDVLKEVMDKLPIGIAVNSVDPSVNFEYMNDNFLKFYRVTREQLASPDSFWEAVYEDPVFREEIKRRVLDDCAGGDPERMHWENIPISRKGQAPAYISARNTLIKGKRLMISTVWDVTARRMSELERERLMQAIDQAAEIIVITDTDASIQYVNPAFEQITGYSRDEVLGKNPRFLQGGKQSPAFYKKMWERLLSGKVWSGRFINKKKDGSLYTEEANISPVYDADGKITNYVAAKFDITRELELEEQLRQAQKMEAVGQMAGGIAHDFNNLLQVICGYAELAGMSGAAGGPLETPIREIIQAAQRGKTVVSQLLAFSRRQVMNPADIDLNLVVSSLLGMIRSLVGDDIELSFVPGDALAAVHADQGLLGQVLVNLCANARDAMPQGGKLTIETKNMLPAEIEGLPADVLRPSGPCVLLSVTDTGCGMDKKTVSRIFEPFYTTKAAGKGTGLGLSMVYGILKQHHAQINVYSEPGCGTVFKIYLPAAGRPAAGALPEESVAAAGGTETILLAEDDEAVLLLAGVTLRRAGYTVLTAVNGEDAVRVFKEHAGEIDMVVLDVVMPKMGGKTALEKIRECRPGLPYLFTSGYSASVIHTDFIQNRNLSLISKPYSADMLLRKIREILDS